MSKNKIITGEMKAIYKRSLNLADISSISVKTGKSYSTINNILNQRTGITKANKIIIKEINVLAYKKSTDMAVQLIQDSEILGGFKETKKLERFEDKLEVHVIEVISKDMEKQSEKSEGF
jgi:hypothetical protein